MGSTRYTVVLTRGSVCTNESGRKLILASLRVGKRNACIPVIDPFSETQKSEALDLLELVTILKHDSGANPTVLKQFLGSRDDVISLSDYIARRVGLSSAV